MPENNNLLRVRFSSPNEVIFEGEALSVSAKNSAGKFDILPLHANFISFIENYPITVRKADQTEQVFKFNFAIIYQTSNQVNIYTDIKSKK